MFEPAAWEEGPALSALSWAVASGSQEPSTSGKTKLKKKKDKTKAKEMGEKTERVKSKKKRDKVSKEMKESNPLPDALVNVLEHGAERKGSIVDGQDSPQKKKRKKNKRAVSSPCSDLPAAGSPDPGEGAALLKGAPRGQLLTRGIRFSSAEAFLRFMGLPGKARRGRKRGRDGGDEDVQADLEGTENEAFKTETPRRVNDDDDDSEVSARKKPVLDISRLRNHLATRPAEDPAGVTPLSNVATPRADSAKQKLSASRFRFLNQQLYCQEGSASASLFRSDPGLFASYHAGYQLQARQWPVDPLNVIIGDIRKLPSKAVIADFGCGEARLAQSVPNTVHSFDLVAANGHVVACDMAKVPLESNSSDVAVFCLALMGTNIRDFIFEAARVLKVSGTLKIAELESRFHGQESDIDQFISDVEKFGFKNSWKDLRKDFFYFLDFQKTQDLKKKKKLPDIELKPCLYKKR